jgi:hypothetical protein
MKSPPTAQFIKVELYNGTVVSAVDMTVINGNYSVIFIPYFILSQNQTYSLILHLQSPYINGLPPQNDPTLTLYLTATWMPDLNLLSPLQFVFDLFGLGGAVTAVWDMIISFGSTANWFVASVTMMVSYVTSLAVIFFNFGVWFLGWVAIMATFIGSIVGLVIGIFNGTALIGGVAASVFTGIGNVWTTFGGTNLILFMPFVIFLVWLQSIDSRQKTMGINFISIAINDFQTVYGLINVLTGFAIFIYSVVSDWARYIYSYMTGFFARVFIPT